MPSTTRDRIGSMWERLAGLRGGLVPNASSDVVPVVIADVPGPYPMARQWFGSGAASAIAANFPAVCVQNIDDPTKKANSRVIIDHIWWRFGAAASLRVAINDASYAPLAQTFAEEASAGDNVTPANGQSGRRPNGSVIVNPLNVGVAAGVHIIDNNDALMHSEDVYFELAPGQIVCFTSTVVNMTMSLCARGRYYEST